MYNNNIIIVIIYNLQLHEIYIFSIYFSYVAMIIYLYIYEKIKYIQNVNEYIYKSVHFKNFIYLPQKNIKHQKTFIIYVIF